MSRRCQKLALSLSLLCCATFVRAELLPEGIKGLKLGMSQVQAMKVLQQLAPTEEEQESECVPDPELGKPYTLCAVSVESTFAYVPIELVVTKFKQGRLDFVALVFPEDKSVDEATLRYQVLSRSRSTLEVKRGPSRQTPMVE